MKTTQLECQDIRSQALATEDSRMLILLENKNYKKGPLQEQAMSPQHEKKNKSTSVGMLSELSCVAEKPQWAEASSESWTLTGQTG